MCDNYYDKFQESEEIPPSEEESDETSSISEESNETTTPFPELPLCNVTLTTAEQDDCCTRRGLDSCCGSGFKCQGDLWPCHKRKYVVFIVFITVYHII